MPYNMSEIPQEHLTAMKAGMAAIEPMTQLPLGDGWQWGSEGLVEADGFYAGVSVVTSRGLFGYESSRTPVAYAPAGTTNLHAINVSLENEVASLADLAEAIATTEVGKILNGVAGDKIRTVNAVIFVPTFHPDSEIQTLFALATNSLKLRRYVVFALDPNGQLLGAFMSGIDIMPTNDRREASFFRADSVARMSDERLSQIDRNPGVFGLLAVPVKHFLDGFVKSLLDKPRPSVTGRVQPQLPAAPTAPSLEYLGRGPIKRRPDDNSLIKSFLPARTEPAQPQPPVPKQRVTSDNARQEPTSATFSRVDATQSTVQAAEYQYVYGYSHDPNRTPVFITLAVMGVDVNQLHDGSVVANLPTSLKRFLPF